MSELTIEEITSNHPKLDEALTLMKSMMSSAPANQMPLDLAKETALKLFSAPPLYVIVIGVCDNKVVGVLGVREFRDPFMYGIGGEVNNFIIDPDYRNRGFGRKMIEYVNKDMKDKYTLEWLSLMADCKKDWLIDFYKSFGYSYRRYNMVIEFPENMKK